MVSRSLLQRRALNALSHRAYSSAVQNVLSPQQVQIIKSTIPALQEHGVAITTLFYERLLRSHPEMNQIFNTAHQATGAQSAALAHAVWAYATNVEHPEVLLTAISRIGHKHASLGITADLYPVVGEGLLSAIKDIMGTAADESVLDAWRAAYQQLADYFISFENGLYRHAIDTPGGWKGWRKFVISKKVVESDEIISFHLSPVDKGTLPPYTPGQFISVRCFIPELGIYQPRQYSLSDIPNQKYFQISVKKESAIGNKPPGRISNVLHESLPEGSELDISMPFGDFVLDIDATTPVVLMSGGVGLTPMMSMLKYTVTQGKQRRVVFVHAVRNGRVHAMKHDLARVMSENPQVSRAIFYEEVTGDEKPGVDYDLIGRIELQKIREQVLLPDADYYICGPGPFMKAQSRDLETMGVNPNRIHMEAFGVST